MRYENVAVFHFVFEGLMLLTSELRDHHSCRTAVNLREQPMRYAVNI